MRRLIYIAFAAVALLAASCQEKWTSSNELGVNETRLNINSTDEGSFVFPVYSGTSWTLSILQGEDWLVPQAFSGQGSGYIDFVYTYNSQMNARVAKFLLKASTGKEITVYVVQNGMMQKASSLSDLEIL